MDRDLVNFGESATNADLRPGVPRLLVGDKIGRKAGITLNGRLNAELRKYHVLLGALLFALRERRSPVNRAVRDLRLQGASAKFAAHPRSCSSTV